MFWIVLIKYVNGLIFVYYFYASRMLGVDEWIWKQMFMTTRQNDVGVRLKLFCTQNPRHDDTYCCYSMDSYVWKCERGILESQSYLNNLHNTYYTFLIIAIIIPLFLICFRRSANWMQMRFSFCISTISCNCCSIYCL